MSASILPNPISKHRLISPAADRSFLGNLTSRAQFLSEIPPIFPKCNLRLRSNHLPSPRLRVSREGFAANSNSETDEALEAVSEILREAGVSEEESARIASNSPSYGKMLIESVRELDEASLWNSWKIEGEDVGNLSFKKKVMYVAKEKGDKGIFPFLESVGLSSTSLMHVARHLSSEKLPELIYKVKYVKEMLFSSSDQEALIGKNARRMMMHLSIFVDDDIQQTLSFFEKMEARRGGLNILDLKDACFPYLMESFPRVLLRSVESHFKPLIEYLEFVGVPRGLIRTILLSYPPILFYDVSRDLKPRLHALREVCIEDNDIGRMLLKYPWILSTSIHENYKEILSFFDIEKVYKASVERAIRSWPHILGCSTSKMKLRMEQFTELGINNKKLGHVIASSPQLLLRKQHEFFEVVSFMEELGFDKESIGRLLTRCPEIFAASVENTLRKKLEILTEFGITESNLPRVIRKYPELLVSNIKSTLLPRMSYLMKVGLSKREVVSMVVRFSPLLGYSIDEVLRPKIEFLLNTMNKPLREVVQYPRFHAKDAELGGIYLSSGNVFWLKSIIHYNIRIMSKMLRGGRDSFDRLSRILDLSQRVNHEYLFQSEYLVVICK